MKSLLKNPDGSTNYRFTCLYCYKELQFALFSDPVKYAESRGWTVNPDEELCPACALTTMTRYPVPPIYHSVTYDLTPIND